MDPEVQKALLKLVEEAKGLATQEIPLVLRDLLVAGTIDACIGITVAGVTALGTYGIVRAYRRWQEYDENSGTIFEKYEMQRFFGTIGIVGGFIASIAFAGVSIYNLLTIWLAPRAYLLGLLK